MARDGEISKGVLRIYIKRERDVPIYVEMIKITREPLQSMHTCAFDPTYIFCEKNMQTIRCRVMGTRWMTDTPKKESRRIFVRRTDQSKSTW